MNGSVIYSRWQMICKEILPYLTTPNLWIALFLLAAWSKESLLSNSQLQPQPYFRQKQTESEIHRQECLDSQLIPSRFHRRFPQERNPLGTCKFLVDSFQIPIPSVDK